MFKSIGIIAILFGTGAYFTGASGDNSYSRDVSRPQAEVMNALEHLDIPEQPGDAQSTESAAGGSLTTLRLEKTANSMAWSVMSGGKVAARMTANFESVDGGNETRVTTKVEPADAPDDFVSPAFRSRERIMGLFGSAIESELNKPATAAAGDLVDCQILFDRFAAENLADQPGLGKAVKMTMRIRPMKAELNRNGCGTQRSGDGWMRPERETAPATDEGPGAAFHGRNADGISFEPGTPMIDTHPKK